MKKLAGCLVQRTEYSSAVNSNMCFSTEIFVWLGGGAGGRNETQAERVGEVANFWATISTC